MAKAINTILEDKTDEAERIQNIPLNEIEPHPGNRKVGGCDKKKLKDLAISIKATGVHQPIIIRRKPGFKPGDKIIYQIVVGERRWRASGIAKTKTIPSIIREISDDQLMEIQFIENIQREDVHPLDESDNYVRMIQTGRYTAKMIADKIGKSTSYVTQRIQLAKLTEVCRQAYIDEKIPFTYAFEISRLIQSEQEKILNYVLEHDWVNLQNLKSRIHNDFLDLTAAPFPLDSDMNSDVPICDSCQERTSINRDLFDDLESDRCTNPDCYQKKADVFLENLLKEFPDLPRLIDDNLMMTGGWTEWDPNWDDPNYEPHPYEKIPSKEGFQECIIVDGERKGEIVLAKSKDSSQEQSEESSYSDNTDSTDYFKINTINAKAYQIVRKTIFSKLMGKLNNINLKTIGQLPPIILEFAKKNKNCLEMTYSHYNCVKPENFRQKITGFSTVEDLLRLFFALLMETVVPPDYPKFPNSAFHEMATGLKIDIEKIQADAKEKAEKEYNRVYKIKADEGDEE